MKRIIVVLMAVAMLFAFQTSDAQIIPPTGDSTHPVSAKGARKAHKGWRLVWSDEFNDNEIDKSSWSRCPIMSAPWAIYMTDADSLCQEKDGVLSVHAINRPEGCDDKRPFLTGGVETLGKRSLHFGRIDVRARFDCAKGFWPAIWLMPDIEICWPDGGEIDIMEHINCDPKIFQTAHSLHTWEWREPETQFGFVSKVDQDVFNVYSVEINYNTIEFYINGVKTGSYERIKPDKPDQFPFSEHPFYLILSAQLGGDWAGEVEPKDLPVKMEIDYVRFYKRK